MGFQPAGVKEFIKLDDTPDDYAGQDGKYTKVKATEDALEFGPAIEGVKVRKNSWMPIIGTRPQLNFKEGAAIGLSIVDNPPDDEVDITINAKYPTRFKVLLPDNVALPTTNPAELATVDGANFAYKALDFDPTTEESAFWEEFLTPDYLSENIVADIYWTSAGAGDVKFGFSVLGREKDETWDSALGIEQTVVTTNLGAGKMNKSRIPTFAPGWSPSDVILFKLARKAGDALDTINGDDVRVLKVVMQYTGEFAQSFYPFPEPIELTIPVTDAWTDVATAAFGVPTGATGVMLHVETIGGPLNNNIGVRKKGSTDNRIHKIIDYFQMYPIIGIDENRKFQVYRGSNIKVYLIGYTATGVVFFDNAYDRTVANHSVWETMNCATECPNAIGIIVEVTSDLAREFGLRHFDSTDNIRVECSMHAWAIVGCDASQRIKGYVWAGLPSVYFHVVGYVTEGAVFKTNGIDKSLTDIGEWKEIGCSVECPSGIIIFMEVDSAVGNHRWGLCKKGLDDAKRIYRRGKHQWAIVPCDSAQNLEGKIENTALDWHITGYATWAGA